MDQVIVSYDHDIGFFPFLQHCDLEMIFFFFNGNRHHRPNSHDLVFSVTRIWKTNA